ncbi:hypothetical protein [Nocardioides sp. MH1]|uniref:hypothetical protein n=1 Tax=Nocardioides sp. MH1 TaxID=3242490 RepID=UPI003520C350
MTQQVIRKPLRHGVAALAVTLLVGATAACSSDGGDKKSDDDSPSDGTSTSATATDTASSSSSPTSTSSADPTENGGYAAMPDCSQFATSVVKGKDVVEGDSTPGKICRFSVGSADDPVAVQLAFIVRGGGDWPKKFKAKDLNTILASAGDDDRDWVSETTELKLKKKADFDYGVRFHQTLGKAERTQFRLFTFAKNGDLLQCYTNADEKYVDSFEDWCGDVLKAVQP